jgi:hypothetical protein
MAKYIGTYANSGDVQTALNEQELNRPFIAYTTDNEDVIFGAAADKAEAGDIVVYSTGDTLLHYIKQADYSASTYPVADYVPVGVVAYPQNDDAILGPTGEITFMGLNWLDMNNPDTGNITTANTQYGYNFDIPELTNYANSGTAISDMNGKANTEIVLQYATAQTDWRTASAITWSNEAGYYPLFECAWRYHTSGTVQGDWYIPACGQLWNSVRNQTVIDVIDAGYVLLGITNNQLGRVRYGTSTELDNSKAWSLKDGSYPNCYFTNQFKQNGSDFKARPFSSKLMTRI